MAKHNWKLIGEFSVDAGVIHIGDPCHIAETSWKHYIESLKYASNTLYV